jgi:small subunit ribosomal protein S4
MILKTKKRYNRPFYKQFIKLRKNIQTRAKIFTFKKQKWSKLQNYSLKQLRFFRRYKFKDQFALDKYKFASRGNSYKQRFKNNLIKIQLFKLFYGNLKKKYLKTHINKIKKKSLNILQFQEHKQHNILKFFESRLDTMLYRAKFCLSIQSARQFILHGHVSVNNNIIKTSSYIIKNNDLIEISKNKKSRLLVKKSIDRSNFWPIPPRYLHINYKTLQIIAQFAENTPFIPMFPFYLNVNSIISNINRY